MKRTRAQERASLERAILRALRAALMPYPGKLNEEIQAQLYGLEVARRRVAS